MTFYSFYQLYMGLRQGSSYSNASTDAQAPQTHKFQLMFTSLDAVISFSFKCTSPSLAQFYGNCNAGHMKSQYWGCCGNHLKGTIVSCWKVNQAKNMFTLPVTLNLDNKMRLSKSNHSSRCDLVKKKQKKRCWNAMATLLGNVHLSEAHNGEPKSYEDCSSVVLHNNLFCPPTVLHLLLCYN